MRVHKGSKCRKQVPFQFSSLGQLAATGRRTGVANVLGIQFSGFAAWWLWRTVYLTKLPRLEKKLRVALDWTLDLVFSKDLVQFLTVRAPTLSRADEELDWTAGPQREAPMLAQEGPADSLRP
jgi:alternative NADH:quinone oxidoreductase NDH2-like protein